MSSGSGPDRPGHWESDWTPASVTRHLVVATARQTPEDTALGCGCGRRAVPTRKAFCTEGHAESFTNAKVGPGRCGSVDCALACEPKGRWFYAQSGDKPGLWARSLVGGMRGTSTYLSYIDVSPPFSLPSLSLKVNEIFKNKNAEMRLTLCSTSTQTGAKLHFYYNLLGV